MAPPVPLQYPWHWGKRGKYRMYLASGALNCFFKYDYRELIAFCKEPLPTTANKNISSLIQNRVELGGANQDVFVPSVSLMLPLNA